MEFFSKKIISSKKKILHLWPGVLCYYLAIEALNTLPSVERVHTHEALKYINGQYKLSYQYVKWVSFF